jgi:hypothetical protein
MSWRWRLRGWTEQREREKIEDRMRRVHVLSGSRVRTATGLCL